MLYNVIYVSVGGPKTIFALYNMRAGTMPPTNLEADIRLVAQDAAGGRRMQGAA